MATENPSPDAPADPFVFDIETVRVPLPTGDGPRHLYEAKICFTAPAGYSMNDIHAFVFAALLHGSKGKLEMLAQYGGALKNKTLMSPEGRKASRGMGMVCTAFENMPIPKKDTTIMVVRKKGGEGLSAGATPVADNAPPEKKPTPKKAAPKKGAKKR